ncbi:MAG: hypothetical protein JWN06_4225 [Propionibacteriaceae bacterium]|nr:hypothetical protein [Propionibacteriaceae bacterium]
MWAFGERRTTAPENDGAAGLIAFEATNPLERLLMRQAVHSDQAPRPGGSYSQAIATGQLFFSAGMGPVDPATGLTVGHTIEEQTAQVLENLEAVLAADGLTLADVVKVTTHLQELKRDFAGYDAVYRSRMVEPYPVRTTVGSQLMNILVEIDVVAVRPQAD